MVFSFFLFSGLPCGSHSASQTMSHVLPQILGLFLNHCVFKEKDLKVQGAATAANLAAV
jgi:hypothetical protein